MTRAEILSKLEERVARARFARDEASQRFKEVIKDVPSTTPYPDGALEMRKVSKAYLRAVAVLEEASRNLTDFLVADAGDPEGAGR